MLADNARLRARLAREVARREHVEDLLAAHDSALTRASRNSLTVGQLAASIVHEVNQPLSAVLTNAETCVRWLSRPVPDVAQALQAAQRTTREADRVVGVVRGLKTLTSNCPSGRTTVDLKETIECIVTQLQAELEQDRIELDLRIGEPCLLQCNRVQLEQVVFNLMRNAMESLATTTERRRCLEVETYGNGRGMVCVEIRDNGAGFDAEIARCLFDPLFTTKPDGMGMGLAISRSIVEAHGGSIEGLPGQHEGATFRFTMPCAPEFVPGGETTSDT
ncbi:sensor histidine kinase [Pararobbsia alpina]|uniref:sensor histidine kinase n=1 Tax=Pararobbsia alpina TaxID=621374 RepID=UPI0039A553F8